MSLDWSQWHKQMGTNLIKVYTEIVYTGKKDYLQPSSVSVETVTDLDVEPALL